MSTVKVMSRRDRSGDRPRRTRVAMLTVTALTVALSLVYAMAGGMSSIWVDPASGPQWVPTFAGYYLIHVAFSVAILRFGLYEIDRIVCRTVTYAAVALVVAVVYTTPMLALPRLLGEPNDLVVAASTLAAAAAFNPARRRIQRAVDHRFNRARLDAEGEIDAVRSKIVQHGDLLELSGVITTAVGRNLQPGTTLLWIRRWKP